MTVKELKQFLQGVPDDAPVYIQAGTNAWEDVDSLDIHYDACSEFAVLTLNKD